MYLHTVYIYTTSAPSRPILQLRPLLYQALPPGMTFEQTAVNLSDVLDACHVEQDVEISEQALHDMPHTGLAHDGEAPHPQPAHEDELGTQGEGFDDVRGTSYTGVEHDVSLVADGWKDGSVCRMREEWSR